MEAKVSLPLTQPTIGELKEGRTMRKNTAANGPESNPIDGLDARHVKAIALLCEGLSLDEVAREVGCGRRTLYTWRTDPLFASTLAEAQRSGLDAARARLVSMRERAINALERVLDSEDAPSAVTMRAIELVLDRAGLAVRKGQAAEDGGTVAPVDADTMDGALRYMVERDPARVRALLEEVESR